MARYVLSKPRLRSINNFSDRLNVNAQIIHNKYLCYPVEKGHDEWCQVGRGQITDPMWCGRHTSFYICRDKGVHQGIVFNGDDYSGKDAVTHGHRWCKKPECPRCFLDGWAGDNARAIWGKLSAGVERGYGDVEHFTVSFSPEDWNLPEGVLRKRAEAGCLKRGIMGAVLISHARRINRKHRTLKFGIHYHGLGFISGGYDVCRTCDVFLSRQCGSGCGSCKGYEARTRREKVHDGLIVKVFGKRNSGLTMEECVVKTSRYILSHASYIPSFRKRFYIVSYFGVCANKRLKSLKVNAVHNCPVCSSVGVKNEMKRCHHWSSEFIAKDIGDPNYKKCFASEEFDESGLPRFVDGGGGLDG